MPSVLLLEDDPGLSFTFSEALKEDGCDVTAVSSCAEAVSILQTARPDLIILDLHIGSEDSINVASFAAYKVPTTPVLYITGSRLFTHGELFDMGNNIRWVLRKPVSLPDLKSMVGHMLMVDS